MSLVTVGADGGQEPAFGNHWLFLSARSEVEIKRPSHVVKTHESEVMNSESVKF